MLGDLFCRRDRFARQMTGSGIVINTSGGFMNKQVVSTSLAPSAIGPYSPAIRAGDMLCVKGQVPIDPATGQVIEEKDIQAQTRRVLQNIIAIVTAGGGSADNIVKTTVFLADFGDFPKMNEVYATYFTDQPPARSTVGVSTLPKNARVEIEAIAMADESDARGGKSVSDTSG